MGGGTARRASWKRWTKTRTQKLLLLGLVPKEFRRNRMFGVLKHRSTLGCVREQGSNVDSKAKGDYGGRIGRRLSSRTLRDHRGASGMPGQGEWRPQPRGGLKPGDVFLWQCLREERGYGGTVVLGRQYGATVALMGDPKLPVWSFSETRISPNNVVVDRPLRYDDHRWNQRVKRTAADGSKGRGMIKFLV